MIRRETWSALLLLIITFSAICGAEPVRSFGKGGSVSHNIPPQRLSPEQMPAFQRGEPPAEGSRLDQFQWTFVDSLIDDANTPNACPTGILFLPSSQRGFISTFHTIFRTEDGGAHWTNAASSGTFQQLRQPDYVYGMAACSADASQNDTVHIVCLNTATGKGYVRRVVFRPGSAYVDPFHPRRTTDYWLGHIVMPDTMHLTAIGSWDGYALSLERSGSDCLWVETQIDPLGGWVTGPMAYVDGFICLAGTRQWVSHDSGRTWQVRPSADEICDGGAAFVDTLYGWTGGGRATPVSQGWVHRTTDGGISWSERLLETDYPIRTVHFLTRDIGFAAGGNYLDGVGGIWSTTDGGQTWQEDMTVTAEITVLGSRRYNPAYVDIFAAGFYPDFIGGVWHRRLLLPDTTDVVLIARPDPLDFGTILPGNRDTLSFYVVNLGIRGTTTAGFSTTDSVFQPLPESDTLVVLPGDSVEIPVGFRPDTAGTYDATIVVDNAVDQLVEVACQGVASTVVAEVPAPLLPQEASISVCPNPGNPSFHISFTLPTRADIRLVVYNVLGRQVATLAEGPHELGSHRVTWLPEAVPSGVYFVRLEGIASPRAAKLFVVR
jgi:hypothetical protein